MSCNPCRSTIACNGKVQPPHYIYVGGDGRLKLSKQSTNINTSTFYPQTLVHASVLRRLRIDFARDRQSSLERSNRPSSANRRRPPPTGSLPRCWGVWFQTRRVSVLRIALRPGPLRRELRRIAPDVEGTQGRVRVTRF